MPDYSLCKVYKIISNQTDKVYIGSTCQELSKRMASHRREYKYFLNGKSPYVSSFEIVKYPDCRIILVQSFPDCKNITERCMYEQDFIDKFDCVNQLRAYISPEQKKEYHSDYRKNNKEQIKIYFENNKDKLQKTAKEKGKQKVLCECGREVSRWGLSNHKTTQIHKQLLNNLS